MSISDNPKSSALLRVGPSTRVFVTGCPIVPPDFSLRATAHQQFGLDRSIPTVLITGGGQGSLALNKVVAAWLEQGGAAGHPGDLGHGTQAVRGILPICTPLRDVTWLPSWIRSRRPTRRPILRSPGPG